MAADTPRRPGTISSAAGRRQRDACPRLGPGVAPERGDEQPRAARGLQRQPAQDHRRTTPSWRRTRRCSTSSRRCEPPPDFAALSPRAARKSSTTNCAISVSAAPNCRRGQEGALQGDPGRAVAAVRQVRGKPARRHQRLRAVRRRRGRAGRHARRRAAGGARSGAEADDKPAGSSPCTRRPICR